MGDYSPALPISHTYQLFIAGEPVPTYAFDPMGDSSRVDFAWVSAQGVSKARVEIGNTISEWTIEPKSYEIEATASSNLLEFEIGPYSYTQLSLNGLHKLIIFIDCKAYPCPDPLKERVFNVRDCGVACSGEDTTESLQAALDMVSEKQGTLYFPPGLYTARRLRPKSNTRIHLDFGAVISAVSDAKAYEQFRDRSGDKRAREDFILIEGQENVTIEGPGIIHANGISLALSAGTPDPMPYKHGEIENVKMSLMTVKAQRSRNISVKDVLVLESTEWAITFFDCDDVEVSNAKVINYPDWFWSDGIHFTSCRNALADSCYAYCGDDAFVVTTRVSNAPTRNVVVRNCVAGFTTCTGVRVGWYARSEMENVLVENIIIVTAGRGIDLLHYGYEGQPISNITFRGIVIEGINDDGSTWQNRCPILFDMRQLDPTHKEPGMVTHVVVEDFDCKATGPHPASVTSWGPSGYFSDGRFKNVRIAGQIIQSHEDLQINEWTQGVSFG